MNELTSRIIEVKHLDCGEDNRYSKGLWLFYPFLVMHLAYDQWKTYIKPIPMRFKMNSFKKDIIREYNKYSKLFFEKFEVEQQCDIGDCMLSLREFCHNELFFLRLAFMEEVSYLVLEEQERWADILMIGVLARAANELSALIYEERNIHVTNIADDAILLGREYMKSIGRPQKVDVSNSALIKTRLDQLLDRFKAWMFIQEDKEKS